MPVSLPAPAGAPATKPRELTGRFVLAVFLVFFGVVFAVNAAMLWAAIATFGGVEVASAYRAGVDYPRDMQAIARQDALGWAVTGGVARAAAGAAVLTLDVRDSAGRPVDGARVEAALQRPVDRRLDREAVLAAVGEGRYRAVLDGVPAGQWDFAVFLAAPGGETFRSRNRILVR